MTITKRAPITPEAFKSKLEKYGVRIITIDHRAGYLKLQKTFPAGDRDAYAQAEGEVGIIYETPSVGSGSVWGTDGGSVGGMVGLNHGFMELNKSNVSKQWLAKLAKIGA